MSVRLEKASGPNDGSRTLWQSILVPEVAQAIRDWQRNSKLRAVLIGGVALSFYVKPRTTTDADFLFFSAAHIPHEVEGFTRVRLHAFRHKETHVEIEMLTAGFIRLPQSLVNQVFHTAKEHDGVLLASMEALVALKLMRWSRQDIADVAALFDLEHKPDMKPWLSVLQHKDRLNQLLREMELPEV